MIIRACFLLLCMGVASTALAQTAVLNPRYIEFESSHHNTATRYDIGFVLAGASEPLQTISIPASQFSTLTGTPLRYRAELPRPVFGEFVALVKLVAPQASGGEVASDWSAPSNPFAFDKPLAPTGVRTVQ